MKIIIPTSLSDITLGQYLKYQGVLKAEDITPDIQDLAGITIFCKLTIDQANQIPIKEHKEIASLIGEVLKSTPRFLQRFTLNKIDYGFIPNLDTMTAGEYISLDGFLQSEETYPEAMAVLYRLIDLKIGDSYTIKPYTAKESRDVMLDLPLEIVFGAMVFFWNLRTELLTAMNLYLQSPQSRDIITQALGQNGVGINQFLSSLEETVSILKKPRHLQ